MSSSDSEADTELSRVLALSAAEAAGKRMQPIQLTRQDAISLIDEDEEEDKKDEEVNHSTHNKTTTLPVSNTNPTSSQRRRRSPTRTTRAAAAKSNPITIDHDDENDDDDFLASLPSGDDDAPADDVVPSAKRRKLPSAVNAPSSTPLTSPHFAPTDNKQKSTHTTIKEESRPKNLPARSTSPLPPLESVGASNTAIQVGADIADATSTSVNLTSPASSKVNKSKSTTVKKVSSAPTSTTTATATKRKSKPIKKEGVKKEEEDEYESIIESDNEPSESDESIDAMTDDDDDSVRKQKKSKTNVSNTSKVATSSKSNSTPQQSRSSSSSSNKKKRLKKPDFTYADMEEFFHAKDIGSKGYLSLPDLVAVAGSIDEEFKGDDLDAMLLEANKTGPKNMIGNPMPRVTLKDFLHMMRVCGMIGEEDERNRSKR